MADVKTVMLAFAAIFIAAVLYGRAMNDQAGFRKALEQVPPSQRVIFPSQEDADKWAESRIRAQRPGDSGVYFIPNDTREWWQFWRPTHRPVYWTVGRVIERP